MACGEAGRFARISLVSAVASVALVTGSSRGIGRGIALSLAAVGYNLVINYAGNRAAAEVTAEDCRTQAREAGHDIDVQCLQADIGDAAARQDLVDRTRAHFGRLDLLVNNAGITSIGRADVLEATEEAFDRLMAVNLKGPYFLTQRVASWMIEQKQADAQRQPKVITISSISAYTVSVNRGDYCLAKAALGMMTKLYAVRLAQEGIGVFEICPGIIDSDMTAPVKEKYDTLIADGLTPIRRWGKPEDIGRAVVAIAQDQFPFSTGEVINVDGGFHLRHL